MDSNILSYATPMLSYLFSILAMIVCIIISCWPAAIVIIIVLIVFVYIFIIFRKVFPMIKRAEAISRSPVLNICGEVADCLVSIRAY